MSGTSPVGPTAVTPGSYTLAASTAGSPATGKWVCQLAGSNTTVSGTSVTLAAGDDWSCTFTPTGTFTAKCDSGLVYAITGSGTNAGGLVHQVNTATGEIKKLSTSQTGSSSGYFNGLGIGAGGSPIYAFRSTDGNSWPNAQLLEWDSTAGGWMTLTGQALASGPDPSLASSGVRASDTYAGAGTNLVAGAVDLRSGRYMFGGFSEATGATGRG